MVKNYKKKRKTKKIKRKTKRIKRKTQRCVRNHTKLIGGSGVAHKPRRTYLVIGSLSIDAENELHEIIDMDYYNKDFDVSVVFILEQKSKFKPKDISNVTKSTINTNILNYDSTNKKNIEIDIKADKFMITSQPPEDKIEMGTLSSGPDGVKIRELFSTSNSIIIINGYVKKRGDINEGLYELKSGYRFKKCYKKDENLFLERIPQIIPLIISHKGKIHSIYTQIINDSGGGHQQFAKLNLPFYYYFITKLYNTGYTLSETEGEYTTAYLTELVEESGTGVLYQHCLRDLILNL